MIFLILIMILNFTISWFNAWSVGKSWVETKIAGGWPRVMLWCGAIMGACGFTWTYVALIALLGQMTGLLPVKYSGVVINLGYLAIIFPILGSGLAITVQSWAHFWRTRSLGSGLGMVWNTFAQFYNTYEAIHLVPEAIKNIGSVFGGNDEEDAPLFALAIMGVVVALLVGILTTVIIIRKTIRNHASDIIVKQYLGK